MYQANVNSVNTQYQVSLNSLNICQAKGNGLKVLVT